MVRFEAWPGAVGLTVLDREHGGTCAVHDPARLSYRPVSPVINGANRSADCCARGEVEMIASTAIASPSAKVNSHSGSAEAVKSPTGGDSAPAASTPLNATPTLIPTCLLVLVIPAAAPARSRDHLRTELVKVGEGVLGPRWSVAPQRSRRG